jgi:hypothetical protein
MKKPDVKVTTYQSLGDPADERYIVSATTSFSQLADTYATMEFRSLIVEKMAQRFIDENYERLLTGINFEQIEASVLELVKQKFAGLLELEPKKTSIRSSTGPK